MDLHQPQDRGRSPSAAGAQSQPQLQPPINSRRSPSPAGFAIPNENDPSSSNAGNPNSAIGLGLGLEASPHQFHDQSAFPNSYDLNVGAGGSFLNAQQTTTSSFSQSGLVNATTASFDLGQDFTSQLSGDDPSFGGPTEGGYSQSLLNPNFGDSDFTIFPPTTGEQFGSSLFLGDVQQQQLGTPENNMLPSSRPHSPTLPHLLKAEPSSANHSPSFNQHQFSSSPGRHSRNVSLGPEAALLPHQIDWTQAAPQFQGHRRTPSEYSDVSSVAPSPHLVSSDNFDPIDQNHSPMQQPQDMGLYNELHGISNFSISDHGAHSPNHHAGRSPSHSPAISPRLVPQSMPDVSQHNPYILQPQDNNNNYGQPPPNPYDVQTNEAFPVLNTTSPEGQMQMQAPPAINIDYAPPATRTGFDQAKSIDADSLTPPDRGRPKSRPRAVTDPFNNTGAMMAHRTPSASGRLSPHMGSDGRAHPSRSLSPLSRSGPGSVSSSPSRRRQSTSSVPNNVMALRLADPDYSGPGGAAGDTGPGAKRIQKHPATFQCTLCPKRFTRAYNLRSHLRTHTDERPFVCTVCGKAFARQHDRKRHEGLHSGEKKFVCRGELGGGGQWGCGRRFARADALGRHFRSEAGRICIKPLLDEEQLEKQRQWNEQRMQQAAAQGMVMPQAAGMMMNNNSGMEGGAAYGVDASGGGGAYALPQALLAQYPALATINWSAAADVGGGGSGIEDDLSGRSSFDASDYDDADESGYASGPGTGFGPGGMSEGFGEMGYSSDFGAR